MSRKKRYGNFSAHRAAYASRSAHQNAPPMRALLIILLFCAWAIPGWLAFSQENHKPLDTTYATFTLLGASKDNISVDGSLKEIARLAGLALPFVGVLFAFYGVLVRTLCRTYLRFAKGHVVIAGEGPAALHLAERCAKLGHAVVLIHQSLQKETVVGLAKQKIIVLEGDASLVAFLNTARAAFAAQFCAMMEDEAANLRIEAACQSVAAQHRKARTPLILHLLLPTSQLRREARDLRQTLENDRKAKLAKGEPKAAPARVDTRPFSLAETGVRQAMISLAPALLDRCVAEAQPGPHLLLIGFDDTNEAMAAWVLTRMWSAHFGPPRVTVLSASAAHSQSRFEAHFPQAQAHEVWRADIAFIDLPDSDFAVSPKALAQIEAQRGAFTAICVCESDDDRTLSSALGLMRIYDGEAARPMPILMRETTWSEFSKRYGRSAAPENADRPYLVAFGQIQSVSEPDVLLEGEMDRAAALCHLAYEAFMQGERSADPQRKMDSAARGGWEQLGETYRHANRAVADHAVVKIWDGGLRPAASGDHGERTAQFDPDIAESLAMVEHARWNAERILDGWMPGPTRNDRARIHPCLVPWDSLNTENKKKDREMVALSATATRWIYPHGLVRR